MRIGIISDIHSNVIALKACLDYLETKACDEYFFLGDYVSDTPYTRETMDMLYAFMEKASCHFLRGNREEYMLAQRQTVAENRKKDQWLWNSASGNLLFAYQQLTDRDFDFFQRLPITFQYRREDYPAITCCHGSPENSRELLYEDQENTKNWLEKAEDRYMICGHTHLPCEMMHKDKHYLNPGCVGIAIKDYGYAQCMILEGVTENGKAEWKPIFLKIPYDYRRVVNDIRKSGLLDKAPWFINNNIYTLLTGTDRTGELVSIAFAKAKESDKNAAWPRIDEAHFEAAAKALGIPDYRQME